MCGSRNWTDREAIADRLADLPWDTTIVHGDAKGADRIAAQEAEKLGLLIQAFPAQWDLYGKRAGPMRNEAMALHGAELCIAFWDGRSKGTADMVDRAEKHAIPLELVVDGRP